jgi:hypothetical protein
MIADNIERKTIPQNARDVQGDTFEGGMVSASNKAK